jgi:hypothetical protein
LTIPAAAMQPWLAILVTAFALGAAAWMNYHWMVFQAQESQAELSISDWSSPTDPGGPIGQELMLNFVQIQPYDPQ